MCEMQIVFYDTIENFYKAIPYGFEDDSLNTPFQYAEWQKNLYAEHMNLKKRTRYMGTILFQGNKAILGGHFFIKRSGKHRGVFLLGCGGETDYYDLIYFAKNASEEHIDYLLREIVRKTKCSNFTLTQIPDESLLSKWSKKNKVEPYFINECAWINVQGGYENHLASLSKSVRQNLRTANNRLHTDKHEATLNIFDELVVPAQVIAEVLSLYESRRKTKNNTGTLQVKTWVREHIRKWNKRKYNIIAEAIKDMSGKYLAVYKIDGVLAAYCFGLKDRTDTGMCIMQVAINDDYGKYSPGMLMLTEIFKDVMSKMHGDEFLFDLTNGNEKYKFSLGAVPHYTNYYKFCLKE